jgi:hypothetical protein
MVKISRVMKISRVNDGHGRIITQLGVCDRYVRSEVGAHIKWVWQFVKINVSSRRLQTWEQEFESDTTRPNWEDRSIIVKYECLSAKYYIMHLNEPGYTRVCIK